jgi:hypothetical protein
MANIDKVKSTSIFLKHDANDDHNYRLIKIGKKFLNLTLDKLYKTKHNNISNYFLQPKNTYASYPFGTSFYIDFDLPKLNLTFHEILLRFRLSNNTSSNGSILFPFLMID